MNPEEVQQNLDRAVQDRKLDQEKMESKLTNEIKDLKQDILVIHKKTDQNCKDIGKVGEKVDAVANTLRTWQPYMESYEKELDRAKAYDLVAKDLRSKGAGGKFWLGLIVAILTVISVSMVIVEKFAGR